jgi:hypothetical protein
VSQRGKEEALKVHCHVFHYGSFSTQYLNIIIAFTDDQNPSLNEPYDSVEADDSS